MKLFKSYKSELDMACKVMKSMAEEIIRLREENEKLRKDNGFLKTQTARQGEKITGALDALTTTKK